VARKRPGDDAAGDRPDDEVYEDAIADGDVPTTTSNRTTSRSAAAARRSASARTSSESSKAKRRSVASASFGRIGDFVREVIAELRKVIWPTRKELLTYTGV
jgi:preprotein translocase subunit SecE